LNPRPQAWEACTLPTELHPLVIQTHIKNEIENVKNFEKVSSGNLFYYENTY
jgi:hypothetical protein